MPTANDQPKSKKANRPLGGSVTTNNDTPVDTSVQPDPSAISHDQSDHDHKRQKIPTGQSSYRVEQNAPRRKFNPATDLRQKGARGAKPSQKSKGR